MPDSDTITVLNPLRIEILDQSAIMAPEGALGNAIVVNKSGEVATMTGLVGALALGVNIGDDQSMGLDQTSPDKPINLAVYREKYGTATINPGQLALDPLGGVEKEGYTKVTLLGPAGDAAGEGSATSRRFVLRSMDGGGFSLTESL